MSELLEIDGGVLEGGGQILRMSVALSAILGKPVSVNNIRLGRSKPGLAAQHLKGIKLVAEMCQGKLKGDFIGSTEIEFRPGKIRGGHYTADTQTAGSISLLLQVALPCALMADGPVTLDLIGGTNAEMAPQIDYMTDVLRHTLKKFNADFNLTIHRRGYFPKGGGHVTVEVKPVRVFHNVDITEYGNINIITGWSFVSGSLPIEMAYEMANGAKHRLHDEHKNVNIKCSKDQSFKNMPSRSRPDNCNGIILKSELSSGCVLGSDGLGRRGIDPYQVGVKAAEELEKVLKIGACVDQHTQDQIIIYMALAQGKSTVRAGEITLHTKTAIHIAELIAKIKFNIQPEGEQNLIECTGLGLLNNNVSC